MDTVIVTQNLIKQFGDLVAVNNLNLHINAGESFALLGPDGAGKTTVMRLLCGAITPTAGDVKIGDFDLAKQTDKARELIGYMPQRFSLYESLSVLQNIVFFSDLYGVDKSTRQERMGGLLEFSRLTPFVDRLAGQLSGGMKQKLALICTVIHEPPILLLDEPTTGVDPVSRRDFWKILHRLLAEGVTLLISTPYMDEAERCKRIGLIHAGKLLLVNTPAELKRQMTGEVIEIKCAQPYMANTYLKSHDIVESVQAFSDKLRVLVKTSGSEQEIISFLESQGVNVTDVRKVQPSLEDIFVSRLGK
ncbi:ABC transporter ATP-binding protein [Candidatus Poribacteria bacterium]|nr:ABC transporter ATP-binding protein [Candidatus Poribacteria bacterium]